MTSKLLELINIFKHIVVLSRIMKWMFRIQEGTFHIIVCKYHYHNHRDPSKIEQLTPYVESILWGCQKLNMASINRFTKFLWELFGPTVLNNLSKGLNVCKEVIFLHSLAHI